MLFQNISFKFLKLLKLSDFKVELNPVFLTKSEMIGPHSTVYIKRAH